MWSVLLLFSCLVGVDHDIDQAVYGDLVAVAFERNGGVRYVLSSFGEPISTIELVTPCGLRVDGWCVANCTARLSPGWTLSEVTVDVAQLKGPETKRFTIDIVCPKVDHLHMPFFHACDAMPFFHAYDAAGNELGSVPVGPMR